MKRIGLLSDTHGYCDSRYEKYFAECDEIWHAGDIGSIELVESLSAIAPVRAVCGNIDGGMLRRRFREQEVFTIEGVKVLMTHIGGYPGRYAPRIKSVLLAEKPQLFVAGHSHILKIYNDKWLGLLYINPGAAGRQGWQTVRTLVLLTIDNGTFANCEVVELG